MMQLSRRRIPSLLALLGAAGCSSSPPAPVEACSAAMPCEQRLACVDGACVEPDEPQGSDGAPPIDAMVPDGPPMPPDGDAAPDAASPADAGACLDMDDPCDHVDDDCDGRIDETHGDPCISTHEMAEMDAICELEGIIVCRDGMPACERPADPVELCNGRDDDCDGAVDELPADWVPVGQPSCAELAGLDGMAADGVCHAGEWSCMQGVPRCVDRTLPPTAPLEHHFSEAIYLADGACIGPVMLDVDGDGDQDVVCVDVPVGANDPSNFTIFENMGAGRLQHGRRVRVNGSFVAAPPMSLIKFPAVGGAVRLARVDQNNVQIFAGPIGPGSGSAVWTIGPRSGSDWPESAGWVARQGVAIVDVDGTTRLITTATDGEDGPRYLLAVDIDGLDPASTVLSRRYEPLIALDPLLGDVTTLHIITAQTDIDGIELLVQTDTRLARIRKLEGDEASVDSIELASGRFGSPTSMAPPQLRIKGEKYVEY